MGKTFTPLSTLVLGTTLATTLAVAGNGDLEKIMKKRGLTENDLIRAAKTYTPTGGRDEFIIFFALCQIII